MSTKSHFRKMPWVTLSSPQRLKKNCIFVYFWILHRGEKVFRGIIFFIEYYEVKSDSTYLDKAFLCFCVYSYYFSILCCNVTNFVNIIFQNFNKFKNLKHKKTCKRTLCLKSNKAAKTLYSPNNISQLYLQIKLYIVNLSINKIIKNKHIWQTINNKQVINNRRKIYNTTFF